MDTPDETTVVEDDLVIAEGDLNADFARDCACKAGDDNPY